MTRAGQAEPRGAQHILQEAPSDKIHDAVAEHGWDVLVAMGPENVQYLSGAWLSWAKSYLDRQNIVVWPRTGEATHIAGQDVLETIRRRSRISRFVGYEERGALPPAVIVDTLADVLKSEGLGSGTIGLEMLRTPVLFFERLRELLPDARFESADEPLRRMRMVKTSDELEKIATAARLTEDGLWKALKAVQAGETEHELGTHIQMNVLGNGCDAITILLVGSGEGAKFFGTPTSREMSIGDTVRIDLNALYDGYFCDMGRIAVVGESSEDQRAAYAGQLALKERIIEFIRPGRKCCEIYEYYREQADFLGLIPFEYVFIGLGHGTGINADEYPKLNAGDQTVIEAGMVLNLEPDTIGPNGEIFHVEDVVLVTDDGVDVLTWGHDWSEIPIIGSGV